MRKLNSKEMSLHLSIYVAVERSGSGVERYQRS